MAPDWFTRLTGFAERTYAETQAQLDVRGSTLRSRVNGSSFHIGTLSTPSLGELRVAAQDASRVLRGRLRVSCMSADVSDLHRQPANHAATFQVASQFNLLEMTGPSITPEDGVTRYAEDRTQGPACAMAAGAATIYRNYCLPLGDQRGQTARRQVDCLHDIGDALGNDDGRLWSMQNGYAMCSEAGLASITERLARMSAADVDALRDRLRVGLHQDVQVTLEGTSPDQRVTQVFCSALPVRYSPIPVSAWQAFATLVLDGAYEGTLLAAVAQAARGGSNVVFLTRLGGGAFGNPTEWIDSAIRRAVLTLRDVDLDVRLVSRGEPDPALLALVADLSR